MKILVTGGGGFLGRYIVDQLLKRNCLVSIIGRSVQPDLENRGVKCFYGDISRFEDIAAATIDQEAVFHVAAKAGVWGKWTNYYRVNIEGTRNVIKACRQNGVGRLIYTSTPSVVFTGEPFEGVDESLPYGGNWLCHYAHTKSIAEKAVLDSNDEQLKTVALRPHLIWGVGDPHIIPRILDRARRGRLRIIGRGDNLVDITHVSNAADAHINALDALAEGRAAGKAYFISQGEPVNLWDWINELLQRMEMDPARKKISLRKAYAAGAVLEGIWKTFRLHGEPPMTRFVATEMAKSHFFNISAAKDELGYKAAKSTGQGLEELVGYLRRPRDD